MRGRDAALIATLALLGLLAFLTIDVWKKDGFDVLVGVSLLIIALFAFGVVGALTNPPRR